MPLIWNFELPDAPSPRLSRRQLMGGAATFALSVALPKGAVAQDQQGCAMLQSLRERTEQAIAGIDAWVFQVDTVQIARWQAVIATTEAAVRRVESRADAETIRLVLQGIGLVVGVVGVIAGVAASPVVATGVFIGGIVASGTLIVLEAQLAGSPDTGSYAFTTAISRLGGVLGEIASPQNTGDFLVLSRGGQAMASGLSRSLGFIGLAASVFSVAGTIERGQALSQHKERLLAELAAARDEVARLADPAIARRVRLGALESLQADLDEAILSGCRRILN